MSVFYDPADKKILQIGLKFIGIWPQIKLSLARVDDRVSFSMQAVIYGDYH